MVSKMSRMDEHFIIREVEFPKKPKKGVAPKPGSFDPNLMNSGMYIATPILLGVAIGYFGDKYFHTKPILLLLFLLIGVVASFYNLYKLAKPQ